MPQFSPTFQVKGVVWFSRFSIQLESFLRHQLLVKMAVEKNVKNSNDVNLKTKN